ncbi:MAG TPA: hypothetical protein VH044_05185 [Polyangiaceae bacterium]|jgi:hypothetical protein|nr:hypothetical protein [Polyangiaceae bacterium]
MRAAAAWLALGVIASGRVAWADDAPAPPAPVEAASSASASASTSTATATTTTTQADVDGLRAAIARQDARLDALQGELDAEKRASLRFTARLSGFVQVDWIAHDQASANEIDDSSGALLNQDRFTLRRGHLRVDAGYGLVTGALELDANTTGASGSQTALQVRPIDAEVSVHWPGQADDRLPTLEATVGLMRIPFGFEVQELDWVRPFLERATVLRALFPGEFDLGARLRTTYRFLDWAIAVMNGSPIGSQTFPALDPVHQKDLIGRLGVAVTLVPGVRFRAGVSGVTGTGFHSGTPTTKDVVVWQDANGDGVVQPNEVTVIPGSAATPSRVFHRFALGGDAQLDVDVPYLGVFAVRTEWITASNLDRGVEVADPVSAGRDLRETGWYVGATQELSRWAAIGARYDRYDPDADASAQRGVALVPVDRTYTTLALMAMARWGPQRLLVEYDVNTNPLGISPAGVPVTLADNALTFRAQYVF